MEGFGATYGFPELTSIGCALEDSAKRADRESFRKQLTELRDYLADWEVAATIPAGLALIEPVC